MSFVRKALPFIIAFVTAGVASLQLLEQSYINSLQDGISKHVFEHFYNNRLLYTFFGSLFASLSTLFQGLYTPRQALKELQSLIMTEMLDDLFSGNKDSVRITIFKDASWLRVSWIHCSPLLRHPIKWWSQPKPSRPKLEDGKYIRVGNRVGSENRKSRTFFYYDPNAIERSQGVAGKARQKEGVIVAQGLPDINNIDLHQLNLNNAHDPNVIRVKQYMRAGHIADFETLKRLHRKARHFYGNILFNKKSEPVGVLVIDDIRATRPFDEETQNRLEHYVKLLYPTM